MGMTAAGGPRGSNIGKAHIARAMPDDLGRSPKARQLGDMHGMKVEVLTESKKTEKLSLDENDQVRETVDTPVTERHATDKGPRGLQRLLRERVGKPLIERESSLLKSITSNLIAGPKNLLRNVSTMLRSTASGARQVVGFFAPLAAETLVQALSMGEVSADDAHVWNQTTSAVLDKAADATERGYNYGTSIADRKVADLTTKVTDITHTAIDIIGPQIPEMLFSTASQMVLVSLLNSTLGDSASKSEKKILAYCISEIMLKGLQQEAVTIEGLAKNPVYNLAMDSIFDGSGVLQKSAAKQIMKDVLKQWDLW